MDVSLTKAERRRHELERPPWSSARHPHQQPLEPGWWPGPWNEPIPVDAQCTPIVDDPRPIRFDASYRPPATGYDWGVPYTVVVDGDPSRRKVFEFREDPSLGVLDFLRLALMVLLRQIPSERIPIVGPSGLPWVEGHPADPPSWSDRHYLVVDEAAGELWEGINTRKSPVPSPSWWFSKLVRWDLTKPYSEQAETRGVNGAKVPMLPMTVRRDELVRGRIDHCIGVGLPAYLPGEPVFPATGSDGREVRDAEGNVVRPVPVVAGQRMRLRFEVLAEMRATLPAGSHQLVVATALHEFGAFPADTSARDHGSAWIAPDGRHESSDLPGFSLPIDAFERVEIIH